MKFNTFKSEEIFSSTFEVVNIYKKEHFNILKVKNNDFHFFTSLPNNIKIKKLNSIELTIITKGIGFIKFLKGFYTKTIYFENIKIVNSLKQSIYKKIDKSHNKEELKELFSALFLAIEISNLYRDVYSNWSVSHLFAISGFHLSVIIFIFYYLIFFPYSYIHKRFFIYRNKKFDILLCALIFTFLYLLLIDMTASFLRAYLMFVLGVFLLRSNIEIISYRTLLIVCLLIISLFPTFLFSLSLWFSVIAVFYIFLYIQYFKNLPKLLSILFFNFWIFLVFNPIVHFFFYNTSYEQFLSPFITLFFTIFYPLELLFHLIGKAEFFDSFIMIFLNYKLVAFESITPFWFLLLYMIVSFFSIYKSKAFIGLNALLLVFNLYIYLQGIIFNS